jgi:SAM-dependent methyltransferase
MSFVYEQRREQRWLPPWLIMQNRARYEWAAQFVEGKRVIEVGCGDGSGTRGLVEAGASRIDGFDVSAPAIEAAIREHSDVENLSFAHYAGDVLPVEGASCEVVVSLETIEHVEADGAFVAEIARVLEPSGVFLCSTPNRLLLDPGTTIDQPPFNPHHVREYSPEELEKRLAEGFEEVEMLGQTPFPRAYGRASNRLGRLSPWLAARAHQATKVLWSPFDRAERHRPRKMPETAWPEVLIAICRRPKH